MAERNTAQEYVDELADQNMLIQEQNDLLREMVEKQENEQNQLLGDMIKLQDKTFRRLGSIRLFQSIVMLILLLLLINTYGFRFAAIPSYTTDFLHFLDSN